MILSSEISLGWDGWQCHSFQILKILSLSHFIFMAVENTAIFPISTEGKNVIRYKLEKYAQFGGTGIVRGLLGISRATLYQIQY